MEKINIDNFNKNVMVAKLFCFQKDFERNDILSNGKDFVIKWANEKVKNNFIYPAKLEQIITNHLVLFLLGNDDNKFSQCLLT
jgi:hypothetical protein